MPEVTGVIFLSDIILTSIAVIWLTVATIQDIKKREVANWLNFSLVVIALGIRGITATITSQAYYFLYALIFLAVFFVLANLFYYGRIFAGGDAKLLIALGVVFATTPSFAMQTGNQAYRVLQMMMPFDMHFLITFFINILFVGSLYGILWSVTLAATHKKDFGREFDKLRKKDNLLRWPALFFAFVLLVIAFLKKETMFGVIGVTLIIFPYLFIFIKSVENSCMLKPLKPEQLTEGDWLAKPVRLKAKKRGMITIKPNWQGLSKKEVNLIKKAKIRKIIIKQGVPFVPVFLIALILSFFTNLLLFLAGIFI